MDKAQILEIANSIPGTSGRMDYASNLIDRVNVLPENCRILEVGAQYGGSAITMALTVKERGGMVFSVDPCFIRPKARPESYRALPVMGNLHSFIWNVALHRVEGYVIPLPGTSEEVLQRWDGRLFDLVFIDGDHTYPSVKIDLQWLQFTKPQAWILFDDWIVPVKQAADEFFGMHGEWNLITEEIPRAYKKG
jgi:hypothetical protein